VISSPRGDDNEIVTTNGPTVRGGAVRRFPVNDGRGQGELRW